MHLHMPHRDDEIELIDLLRVLWKWKWMIVGGTLLCAVIAGVISLQLPKVYRVDMIIEPGIIGVDSKGDFIYVDTPDNMSRKINEQAYNRRILSHMNIDTSQNHFTFNAAIDNKRHSHLVHLTSEWKQERIETGLMAMTHLNHFLSLDYEPIIKHKKAYYDKLITVKQNAIADVDRQRKDITQQILQKKNDIVAKKRDVELKKESIRAIGTRVNELISETRNVKENTERLVKERDQMLRDRKTDDDISMLLYSNTIQQNVAYFNELNTQIYDLRASEKQIESQINSIVSEIDKLATDMERLRLESEEGLQTKVNDLNAEVETLKLEKGLIANVRIIQEPEVSVRPVKPKKKQIVVLAGAASFFFFLILAFFIEYVRRANERQRQD